MELCYLLVIAFILYGSTLHGECVFDDVNQIANNREILSGSWRGALFGDCCPPTLRERLRSLLFGWRGLVRASLAFNVLIWGPSTFSFHAGNIILHALNSYIVYGILCALGFDSSLALLGASLFVGHPLATSAVGYMSSRGVLLSSFFGFLGVLSVLAGLSLLAIPCFLLAFASKEDLAVLPISISATAYVLGLSWWAIPLPILAALLWFKRRGIREILRGNGEAGMTASGFAQSIAQPWYSVTAFTETVIRYPFWLLGLKQNVDPDIEIPRTPRVITAVLIASSVLLAVIYLSAPWKIGLIFTVCSPMVLYWFFPMPDPILEYRAYFSLLGVAILSTQILDILPGYAVYALMVWLWLATGYRAASWSSALSLWKSAVRDGSTKERVLLNLGAAYQLRQEHDNAQECFNQVLKKNPRIGPAWTNLGLIAIARNNPDKAIEYFTASTTHCPQFLHAWQALGEVYQKVSQPEKAQACFQQAQLLAKG